MLRIVKSAQMTDFTLLFDPLSGELQLIIRSRSKCGRHLLPRENTREPRVIFNLNNDLIILTIFIDNMVLIYNFGTEELTIEAQNRDVNLLEERWVRFDEQEDIEEEAVIIGNPEEEAIIIDSVEEELDGARSGGSTDRDDEFQEGWGGEFFGSGAVQEEAVAQTIAQRRNATPIVLREEEIPNSTHDVIPLRRNDMDDDFVMPQHMIASCGLGGSQEWDF